ncbi:hypothetical protein Tco_0848359 [Tanacetum coccineum]
MCVNNMKSKNVTRVLPSMEAMEGYLYHHLIHKYTKLTTLLPTYDGMVPKGTPSLGLWYLKCSGFNLKRYSDSDYAGCNMDRKSTSGACQFLGGKLVCWSAKKQQYVAMSSAKADYVAAAGCCAKILWMKSQLTDYDIIYEKHIDIRYHILKGDIELHFIPTQYQLADIFTKPLDEPTFKRLIVKLGMLNIDSKPKASLLIEEN